MSLVVSVKSIRICQMIVDHAPEQAGTRKGERKHFGLKWHILQITKHGIHC